jgi:hypothetical protein
MIYYDEEKKKHPWRMRWERFKLECTELLAKYLHIYIEW